MQLNTVIKNHANKNSKTKGSKFIMKTMKKIFALVLAMMMVFSLALTANAADLTVDGALKGAEYKIYKIADVTVEESGAVVYTAVADWVEFLKDLTWIDFFEGETSNRFVRKAIPTTDAEMATAARAAKEYAAANDDIQAADTAIAAGETPSASFNGVANGYYLMTSNKGSLCTLATITGNEAIREKNAALPQIDKTVNDAEVAIGDTVTFTLTVTTGENYNNEMNYIIHDTMSGGLTLNVNSIAVKHGEETLTKETDYTVNTVCEDDCTFEIVFENTLTTEAYDTITVTYTAVVNGTAGTSATNKAEIDDSKSEVTVTTTEFKLNKTDGTNTLAGAKFELYKGVVGAEGTITYENVPVVNNADGTYRPAVTGETAVQIEAGSVTVKGVDSDEIYYVKETEAPEGYVMIDGYNAVANGVVTVVNVKGEELPETGGMGTTLFYTLGGLMVAAAAVMLITKKRMSAM